MLRWSQHKFVCLFNCFTSRALNQRKLQQCSSRELIRLSTPHCPALHKSRMSLCSGLHSVHSLNDCLTVPPPPLSGLPAAQSIGDSVRALLIRVMPVHEANTIMEQTALDMALVMFRSQLLQQRIKGLKIMLDAVNSVRVRSVTSLFLLPPVVICL